MLIFSQRCPSVKGWEQWTMQGEINQEKEVWSRLSGLCHSGIPSLQFKINFTSRDTVVSFLRQNDWLCYLHLIALWQRAWKKKLPEDGICFGSWLRGIPAMGVGNNTRTTCCKSWCPSRQIRKQRWYRMEGSICNSEAPLPRDPLLLALPSLLPKILSPPQIVPPSMICRGHFTSKLYNW